MEVMFQVQLEMILKESKGYPLSSCTIMYYIRDIPKRLFCIINGEERAGGEGEK